MPSCLNLARKMTGSTSSGPPQPPKAAPKAEQLRGKVTARPQSEQPMQLTPLWEHVVCTRQFPASVDAKSIFCEISDRLRDPEWEVRQHALRVLVDVLPVLEQNIDELMRSLIPEVVTNLGHQAPAVRKGALDTLRVYLSCTQNKENMLHRIMNEGFGRPDASDDFQINVILGVVLSIPSLLFPSSGSPKPPESLVKFVINALASRLIHISYQEAALRSLAQIREIIGAVEFNFHMLDYDANIKRDFEILCDVYNVKIYQEIAEKPNGDEKYEKLNEIVPIIKQWRRDGDSFGEANDCRDETDVDVDVFVEPMPLARVVLETEIKFDEETAITMTILEEKDKESDGDEVTSESDSESNNYNSKDVAVIQVLDHAVSERSNTRRVRFGGEIVKIRTPDSDEVSLDNAEVPKTKIPLPLFPATKMPLDHRRTASQPASPLHSKHSEKRSLSNSPKREIYVHNALLSPKKSILMRPSSPVNVIQPVDLKTGDNRKQNGKSSEELSGVVKNRTTLKQLPEPVTPNQILAEGLESEKKNGKVLCAIEDRESLFEVKRESTEIANSAPSGEKSDSSKLQLVNVTANANNSIESENAETKTKLEKQPAFESPKRLSRPPSRVSFDIFPKQERNYILMELSSPERKRSSDEKIFANDLPFGQGVNDASFVTNILEPRTGLTISDQSLNQINDNTTTTTTTSSGATMTQHFPTTLRSDLLKRSDVVSSQTVQDSQSGNSSKDTGFHSNTKTISHVRNLQSSKELLDQLKNNVVVTSATFIGKEEREKSVNSGNSADENRRFRDLSGAYNRHISSTPDLESESLTCSSSEGEGNMLEPSWEELRLVNQETLNDLHNKDDWRAKVRGFERTASALRASSALLTIEPRLGSLLQAVLGGERSSRIAAAGMAVAKILVSGVSEDALRRRLPQLAWGLARQGGPHAAQLTRIAMLRLRPALFLEQLLHPHCLGARNGKTRENALQLLIFSLVTFPSTEFKIQMLARRVAETVGDRRRRVRQAALDTLAVLGQIYDVKEVLEAGERAASGRHDGDAMKAAIRSRLARKSLPLVSTDGLVVYGLQISPNVATATGADVDWIVAGSGSLSPGSGRSRSQLIEMTTKLDSASIFRSESARSNPWTDRPDVATAGVSHVELQQPFAWQLVPIRNQAYAKLFHQNSAIMSRLNISCSFEVIKDDQRFKEGASQGRNVSAGILNAPAATHPFHLHSKEPANVASSTGRQALFLIKENPVTKRNFIDNDSKDRLKENLLKHCTASSNSLHNSTQRNTWSSHRVSDRYQQIINEYLRKRFYEFCREKAPLKGNLPTQEGNVTKAESRIPVLHSRERGVATKEELAEKPVRRGFSDASRSGMTLNERPRRMTPSSSITATDQGNFNRLNSQDTDVRHLVERNAPQALQIGKEVPNYFSFPRQHRELGTPSKKISEQIKRENRTVKGRVNADKSALLRSPLNIISALPEMTSGSYHSVHSSEKRNRSKSRSQGRHYEFELKTTPRIPNTPQATRDTYGTMYQRRRRLIEGNAFLALQATTNGTSYYPQRMESNLTNRSSRSEALRDSMQKLPERDRGVTDMPTVNLREIYISRETLHATEKEVRRPKLRTEDNVLEKDNGAKMRTLLEHNVDKLVADDEDTDVRPDHVPSRSAVYEIQSSSRNSQYQVTRSLRDVVAYERDNSRPASAESSNSNNSVTESHHSEVQEESDGSRRSQDDNHSNNSPAIHNNRSSTPLSQAHQRTAAFDVVPLQTVTNRRNSVNSYVVSVNSTKSNLPVISIADQISDEDSSNSDVDVEHSIQEKLSHDCENHNVEDDTDDTFERKLTQMQDSNNAPLSSEESDQFTQKVSRESVCPILLLRISNDSPRITHSFQQLAENENFSTPSKQSPVSRGSKKTVASKRRIERIFPSYDLRTNESSQKLANSSPKSSELFTEIAPDSVDEDEEAIFSSALPDDSSSLQSLESRSFQELDYPELYSSSNSASIVRLSLNRSDEHNEVDDDARGDNAQSDHVFVSPVELRDSKSSLRTLSAKIITPVTEPTETSTSNKLNPHEISQSRNGLDIPNIAASRVGQSSPLENKLLKKQPSKVPRIKPQPRVNSTRSDQAAAQNIRKPLERPKPSVQLCLTQLESKDWEVITKGLKTLSQIVRQNSTQLDQCGPGTLGRVLGRHVRNLRSQVSRAACLAAGDVFLSQPKGIEQEVDDIVGPLLHRTADTNKFLRADSNAALDRLVENVSPHKTIGVIVHRGATHQNAIVRATTARLLSDIVSRIGPEQAMTLPRDVRDKLLATGAKLLIDGNLDARNFAKKMFRGLSHCEGFQKALNDTVPETTLRHIDKTLRTL